MDPVWRTLTRDDAAAIAELNEAAEAVDQVNEHLSAEDVTEEFDGPTVDAQDGSHGAFIDGRLVAVGILYARTAADPVHDMFFWGQVHPEFRRRGLGTTLTEWALGAGARITERRFPGARCALRVPAFDKLQGNAALLKACGFTADRYEFAMDMSLNGRESGKTQIPDGFTLINFEDALSEEFRETHNIAFVPDHPGSTVQTVESWPHVAGSATASFLYDLSFGLRDADTGTIAGYVFCRHFAADTAATGRRDLHMNYIGTRREYRGRGVASTLINVAADRAADQGFDSASLHVYADNPSGALGVYQRVGFTVQYRITMFAREAS